MTNKLKARSARIIVVRQHPVKNADWPREQLHTTVSRRLVEEWEAHFMDEYANQASGVELGMLTMLYLTGSQSVSVERLASLLTKTFPSVARTIIANAGYLSDVLGVPPES